MAPQERLDSLSLPLAHAYRGAEVRRRHAAALSLCCMAVAQSDLQGDDIRAAMHVIRQGEHDRTLQQKLQALADDLDRRYLDLNEDINGPKPQLLRLFRMARAASALAYTLHGNPEELREALYEAILAVPDQARAIDVATMILTGERPDQ